MTTTKNSEVKKAEDQSKNLPTTPAVKERTITDQVLAKINSFVSLGEITLPKDYSPENALKAAYLILTETVDKDKKPVLSVCTKESIANALLTMVTEGLSPLKKQCAFIAHGNKLTYMREYPGNIALARRFSDLKDFTANVVYEGDTFKFSVDPITGRKRIIEHIQALENINEAKIKGAYAVLTFEEKESYVDIMTIQQIVVSWKQGSAKGESGAHTKFPGEMAKRTVINRACKNFINSSLDTNLYQDEERELLQQPNGEPKETIEFTDAVEVNTDTQQPEKSSDAPAGELFNKGESMEQTEKPKGPGF